jgi:N utilization substance protein B
VAINEALELAKRYSTSQSSRFVNGILDRLQSAGREDQPVEPIPAPPEEPAGAIPVDPGPGDG